MKFKGDKTVEISLKINEINYDSIIEKAIPLLKEKAQTDNSAILKMVSGILNMPGDIPKKMLNALPQETKNELVAYLINNNKNKVIGWLQDTLVNKGFEIEIDDLTVRK